jgi:hypothetical protein
MRYGTRHLKQGTIFWFEKDIYSFPLSENNMFSPSRDTFFDFYHTFFALIIPNFAFILPFYSPFSLFHSPFSFFFYIFLFFSLPLFIFFSLNYLSWYSPPREERTGCFPIYSIAPNLKYELQLHHRGTTTSTRYIYVHLRVTYNYTYGVQVHLYTCKIHLHLRGTATTTRPKPTIYRYTFFELLINTRSDGMKIGRQHQHQWCIGVIELSYQIYS